MEDLQSGAKFYATCAQGLRAAQLGQYGDDFTPDGLRANLEQQAAAFGVNWTDSSFTMVSQTVDEMNVLIDRACDLFQAWIDAGKPRIQ